MKILVVEDDRTVGQYVLRGLQEQGFQADLVADGTEALQAASQGNYDLMVLDLRLPGMTGFSDCRIRCCSTWVSVTSSPMVITWVIVSPSWRMGILLMR